MKFIYETPEPPTFGNVEENQFFVDKGGYLCQKIDSKTFAYIADQNGEPFAFLCDKVSVNDKIDRLIPKVTKIEF